MSRTLLAFAAILALCAGCTAATPPAAEPSGEQPKGVTLPDYETVELPNGMTLLLMERHDVPMIAFRAMIRGGAVADPAGREGTGALLAELLRKGAGSRDAAAFAEAVAAVGGRLNTRLDKEALIVGGLFMARDQDLMLELLGDLLMAPLLAEQEFEKLTERQVQQIKAMKDTDLRSLTTVYGDAFLFGDHPYGKPVIGSEAGLARVGHADVLGYYRDHVGADRTVLAVVGDFDARAMRARLEARFAGWRRAEGGWPPVPPPGPVDAARVLLVDKPDATQTYFYLGSVGVARDYPDDATLDLVNTVFGGRFTSMLNTKLRVESGLTYGAGSRLERNLEPGSVAIVSFTRTEATVEAIDMAVGVLETLHSEALSAEQLASARAYVLGQFPPDLETAFDLAGRLAEIRFYGLGREDVDGYAERVNAVTLAAARRVVEEVYPSPGRLVYVLIGNAAEIREQVAKYGPVTEIRIADPAFTP